MADEVTITDDDVLDADESTVDEQDDGHEAADAAESLGDAGKQALDRMKARFKAERDKRIAAEKRATELAKADDEQATETSQRAAKANARIIRAEVRAAAKGVLTDPADALTFLDLTQFEVDDDGGVDEDEIADAIRSLVEKKPYLAAQGGRRFGGTADGGARKEPAPKSLADQIAEAEKAGDHSKARALKVRLLTTSPTT